MYIDCTLGGAGHALYLLNQLNDDGRLIAIDQDQTAIDNAKEVLKDHLHKVTFVPSNFRELTQILKELKTLKSRWNLLRLGCFKSTTRHSRTRFSYHHDATLDMRMDQTQELTAYEIVNNWSYEALVKIFIAMARRNFQNR